MTTEYLLEVRCRDQPPRLVEKVLKQLSSRLFEDLMGRGLGPEEIVTGMTPRRLFVCLRGMPRVEPAREHRELGPAVSEAYGADGVPTVVLESYLERTGVHDEDLEKIQTERGAFLGIVREVAGQQLEDVLADLVSRALVDLEWWRPMRESGPAGILSVFDGDLLPCELLGVAASRYTAGQPVLSPGLLEIRGFEDYRTQLSDLGIVVEVKSRRQALKRSFAAIAKELDGELVGGPELLDQLTAACEIPGVIHGAFDEEYLALPEEVLLAALGGRSKAFGVRGSRGLLPSFLTMMDRIEDPVGDVRSGQERAVAGSLADARFRYADDRRRPLAERSRQLAELDFHPRLGSYADKAERIRALAELGCQELGWEDVLAPSQQAAGLLKADLTTGMVRDFPALRGTVGGIYAREEGYVEAVWRTVSEHYRSRPIPGQRVGQLVGVVDRLDSLVGFLGIDQAPSGSKDPFGLRRLARGLLRILIDAEMELDLDLVAARAVLLYEDRLDRGAEELVGELQTFLAERSRHLLGQRGFSYEEIEAAAAVGTRNLPDLVDRLQALKTVREEPDFRSLVLAAKRIFNIVKDSPEFELRPEELAEGAEHDLYEALRGCRQAVDRSVDERRYEECLRSMIELVPHLDRFFAEVLVMDENERLRANRIGLLQTCRRLFWRIARLKEMTAD